MTNCIENNYLFSWGSNEFGQLGLGSDNFICLPGVSFSKAKYVEWGTNHTLVLSTHNEVYSWGDNRCGQLGHSSSSELSSKFQKVSSLQNIKSICAGSYSAALSISQKLYIWGLRLPQENSEYQEVTIPTKIHSVFPSLKSSLYQISNMSLSSNFIILKNTKNELFSWGSNSWSELGHQGFAAKSMPVHISSLPDDIEINKIAWGLNFVITTTSSGVRKSLSFIDSKNPKHFTKIGYKEPTQTINMDEYLK